MSEEERDQLADDDVEAHAKRFHMADDAEAPKDVDVRTGERGEEESEKDKSDRQAKRFH